LDASFNILAVEQWLSDSLSTATRDGRYIVIAYYFPSTDPSSLSLLTASRRFFAEIGNIFEEEYPNQVLSLGRELDPTQAARLAALHRKIFDNTFRCVDFDSRDRYQRRVARQLISDASPSQWVARGFMLFDIVSFSTRTAREQVTLRLTLDSAIRHADRVLRARVLDVPSFNLIPTGDGFYVWSTAAQRRGDATTLALGAFTLAALSQPDLNASAIRVRAAFAIGQVFTLPTPSLGVGPPVMSVFRDAIGPAPNIAARLATGAAPDQLLVAEFLSDRVSEWDVPVRSTADLLAAAETLVGDPDFQLRIDPPDLFKVIDKHGEAHRCYNVNGQSFYYVGSSKHLVSIGLATDSSRELKPGDFR
jgi:hypothetical protein